MLRLCLPFALCLSALFLTPAQAAPGEITGVARVIDGDTLDVGDTRVRLFGIDAVERDQTCRHPTRGDWPCGRDVAQEVAFWLNGERLSCRPEDRDRYGRVVATCYLREADVGAVLVEAGLAFAYSKYSDRYETLQARALAAGRGLWTSVVVQPERFRRGTDPVVPAQAECRIKGNISSKGTRIYHLPGQEWYNRTRISPENGERWFCSEAEARRAGWRKARR
ncbi:thermonuclease family protein [Marinovum sp.]|uniref:thermonuclease family protein n=1 Tax=Marinovum sp. TaxID=2024839 RepID=UPI003A959766